MPDLNAILQQLGMQPISGNPASGQAQYASGWQGLAAGIQDSIAQRNNQQRGRIEDTRSKLSQMIDSIPDTEENAPLKLKLKLDIMNAGGGKHWSDKVLAPNDTDKVIQTMFQMFGDKLPRAQPQPSLINPDENGNYTGLNFAVSPQGPGGGQGINIPAPVDNRGKFDFSGVQQGKWREVSDVFQDEETGEKYLMLVDQTGKSQPKRINLGKAKTVSEINAEKRARQQQAAKNLAVSRGYYDRAVALSGIGSPESFNALPLEVQDQYYAEAGRQLQEETRIKLKTTESTAAKNTQIVRESQARIPKIQAETENLLAQPKDPNAVTTDEARTLKTLTETLDYEIRRLDKLLADPTSMTRKQLKEFQGRRAELVKQRDAIRNQVLQPNVRIQSTKPREATPKGGIPRGSSGPVGKPNDRLGIR